jgi:xanthine dehydrogenase accessory factor
MLRRRRRAAAAAARCCRAPSWPDVAARLHLQLHGAGHVGRAIVRALAPLDVTVDWIDGREESFPRSFAEVAYGVSPSLGAAATRGFSHRGLADRDAPAEVHRGGAGDGPQAAWPPHIRKVCVDAVEAEVPRAPAGACFLVMTHEHDLDLRLTEAILRHHDFRFFGLIGSSTKRRRFSQRLLQRGFDAAAIERIVCPIGLPGIEGKEPAVIAASVVAQLLSLPTRPPTTSRRHDD